MKFHNHFSERRQGDTTLNCYGCKHF
jgi:hypothetical protein